MRYRTFVLYNIAGALLWTGGTTLLGYFLGKTVPHADKLILPVIGAIIFASLLPSAIPLAKRYLGKKQK